MKSRFITSLAAVSIILTGCSSTAVSSSVSDNQEFEPKLDTDKNVSLKVAGFLGNFEALDQIVNEFNEYYPNVVITYESNGSDHLSEYVSNNDVDIFMTADQNIRYKDQTERYAGDYCLDLSKEDLDLDAIEESYIDNCTIDGKLYSIPLGQNTYGMAVNTTLLEKEGLSVPTDYDSFVDTLDKLVKKGYVPIQGSSSIVGAYILDGMIMSELGSNEALLNGLKDQDEDTVATVNKAMKILETFMEKGYFTEEKNAEYPDDNYDGAIMNFFEGDVPFWMCSSENFSGTKKREAKSDKFSSEPFDYSFMQVPLSKDGVYAYSEAWYGFSVNKDSSNHDYAMEFMRYLVRSEEISEMAELKGIPSVTGESNDDRYAMYYAPEKTAVSYKNTGNIEKYMHESLKSVTAGYLNGEYASTDDATKDFVQKCAEVANK